MSQALTVRDAQTDDLDAIANLQAQVFGPGRFARTAYRVREGAPNLTKYCRVGFLGDRLVAALNFTEVSIGGTSGALLLGPFVVEPEVSQKGLGAVLMERALLSTKEHGVRLVILVGDEPYYNRFGFIHVPIDQITLPGAVDPNRILALEYATGALSDYHGLIRALPAST